MAQRSCLITALRGLTAERRAVFILRHVLGLSPETCAEVCHCAARLGNALDRGLVRWPEQHEHDGAPLSGRTYRTVQDLYASLPRVRFSIVQ